MNRGIQFAGVVWLGAMTAVGADQKPPKNPPPPKNQPVAKPAPQAPPPNNRGGVPKGQTRLPNPDNPIDRLLRMSPEQRERAIEKFPPQQQANFRKRFENFDKQPEAQKQRQLEHLDQFWTLPPDKQKLVHDQMNAFNALPEDRREEVKRAYLRLSRETPEGRDAILARPQFRSRFTPAELQILTVLPQYWPQ
jgi:Protein of unknown function (DUF3106)